MLARTRKPHSYRPRLERLEDRLVPVGDPLIDLLVPGQTAIQSSGGVLTATLNMAQGNTTIDGNTIVNAWTYNGRYVGPTLMVQPGDLLDLIIENDLPDEEQITNLHTHGLHVSPIGNSDNVLLQIMPGEDNHFQIQIPDDHPEGLYWYHPHHHGTTFDQISMGLSGLIVIGQPSGKISIGATVADALPQTTLALKNALLAGNQIVIPATGSDLSDQTFTVNGQVEPELTLAPNEWRVFNVANTGNNSFYRLQVHDSGGNPVPLLTLASDGNPFTEVLSAGPGNQLGLPPGRRWTFTFQPPSVAETYTIETIGFNAGPNTSAGQWPATTLMTIDYTGTPTTATPVILGTPLNPTNQNYVDLRTIPAQDIAAFRNVIFTNNGATVQMINGNVFPNNAVFQPRLNTVEEWTLTNNTTVDHPFHMHVNPQQVVSNGGQPFYFDVINVPKNGGTVTIRVQFLDFLGEFVYHCHRVDHEDHGMMALVDVIPESPIYATGSNAGKKSHVKVFDPVTDSQVATFKAFGGNYTGGVNVAVGDVNGDGISDVLVGKEQGEGKVKVVNGTMLDQVDGDGVILNSALLSNFTAYGSGGVFVSAGDIDGSLGDEIVVGKASGTGKVKIFDPDGMEMDSFYAFGQSFAGGTRVATGDIDGDGRIDIIAGKGPGSTPQVKIFGGMDQTLLASFLAFGEGFKGGVYVGTGNTKGFAYTDIIVGKGSGNTVKVFSDEPPMDHLDHEMNVIQIASFEAYGSSYDGGVRVTSLHDPLSLTPFGGNKDSVVTTKATGEDTIKIFPLDIAPPPPPSP